MALRIEAARVNKQLTQEEAAKLIGISKDCLSNYERGKTAPNVIVAKKMAEVYGVGIDDLIFCLETTKIS